MRRRPVVIRLIRCQRGVAVALTVVFLPLLLGAVALSVDLARARVSRAQAQAAADAAALAGTLAARVRQEWEYVPHEHHGRDGSVWTHVHRVLVREWVELAPDEAYERARQTWARNAAHLRGGTLRGFEGRAEGAEGYHVEARLGLRTILARTLAGQREIEIAAGATARARLR